MHYDDDDDNGSGYNTTLKNFDSCASLIIGIIVTRNPRLRAKLQCTNWPVDVFHQPSKTTADLIFM